MRAMRIETTGGPEVLREADVPLPQPGPGQARVKLVASGVNFIDTYQRAGAYNVPLPFIPGGEGAGVVDAVGPDVGDLTPGTRVASASLMGAYAEYVISDAWRLVPIPEGVDDRTAAAAMLQGMTAHYLAYSTFPIKPGHIALIHAAGGGVGQLLVQVAKRCGAHVIGTAGNERKAQLAREAGADDVILYTQHDFEAETKRLTDGAGVHVVYDSVGKDTFDKGLNCLRPRGCMVLFGQSSGAVPPLNPQVLNQKGSLFLTRPTLGHYIATPDELHLRADDILGLIARGELRVRIDQTFPLADAAEAHRYLEARKTEGKVLLLP